MGYALTYVAISTNSVSLDLTTESANVLIFLQSRMPLQPELVLEDVSQDHAHKTVMTLNLFNLLNMHFFQPDNGLLIVLFIVFFIGH